MDRNDASQVFEHPAVDVPRKGNVDRNEWRRDSTKDYPKTFPARGTWIEMSVVSDSVQRLKGRSPQGERG